MKSFSQIEQIRHLPSVDSWERRSFNGLNVRLKEMAVGDGLVYAAAFTEGALVEIYRQNNVDDSLFDAYSKSFTDSHNDLFSHYSEMVEKGDASLSGFIANLKGKLFEIKVVEHLESTFPDLDFQIASDPTNPIWDISFMNPDTGFEGFIQAKMGAADYATEVVDRMQASPDTYFALSQELSDAILDAHPELAGQIVYADVSNYEFTSNTEEQLELLSTNMGIDVPDAVEDLLPYIGEIVLGIRLLLDVVKVQREYGSLKAPDKARIAGVKAIILISRFGVTTICTTAGASLGSLIPIPFVGTLLGAGAGAYVASRINKYIKPHVVDIAYNIVGLTADDIFYFKNKTRIDDIAWSFRETSVRLLNA